MRRLLFRLPPLLFLLLFFALALNIALAKAPTVDESVHVLRGYALWHTDDLHLQTQPPLSHWLMGSFLLTESGLPDVTTLPGWQAGDRTVAARALWWQSGVAVERVFFLARLPIIFVGMLLGAMVGRWAGQGHGKYRYAAQGVVLLLFAFSPNVLALSSLATTDLVIAATYVAVVFMLWQFWERPSWGSWLLVGVALGLALGAKLTAFLLLPITLILCYVLWQQGEPWWRPGLIWTSFLPVAAVVLWGLYGFEIAHTTGLPFAVPAATYVSNFTTAQTHIDEGHAAYLLGQQSQKGWWHYFLVAFLIKTPLPTLILFCAGICLLCWQWRDWRRTAYFWIPAAALFAVASYTRLNIGYRHILAVLPFAWLLAAEAVPVWWRWRSTRTLLILLLGWYVMGSVRQQPHDLAYFNEIVGGSTQGYRYLGDSNLDWGQDLPLLADYVAQAVDPVYFAYFGSGDFAYYGLPDNQSLLNDKGTPVATFTPANPAAGHYAISTGYWIGLRMTEPDAFDWFRHQQPTGNLGYSILLYDVPTAATGTWVAYCLDPGPLLDQTAVSALLGVTDARPVYFDCRQSWVFPNAGQPGWYILPQQDIWPLAVQFPQHLRLVYRHEPTAVSASYDVYYWDGGGDLTTWLMAARGRAQMPDGSAVDLPLSVAGVAVLEGYRQAGTTWWTAWRVTAPASVSLTIGAHLYGEGDTPLVADGLGFTSEQWQSDDIFVQIHAFDTENGRFLETGLYNYLTGEAMLFADGTQSFVHLYPPQ